ncbi:hypothetical protein GCM10010174_22730 [Kutzneria viridogrisea]|uniref:Secreted protein n=2 Tax=Kutzneria TaxID=43356 RepID=A0ABR6BTP2_9PSEU|nr:hypothetical protein [Kutzneria albida]AHH94252.1 putative secreted protein [Kutzneria albida DSM 43870]MBA8929919.1 hypothetical protein [Kutzneria viridogrisea]
MLKKAGVVAATAAAGLMVLSAPAFAGTPAGDDWMGHHHHGAPHQVGLVNVDDVHALNDVHVLENVNVPICATNNTIAGGLVAVAVNALNPTFVKDCVDGAAISHSGDHHGG